MCSLRFNRTYSPEATLSGRCGQDTKLIGKSFLLRHFLLRRCYSRNDKAGNKCKNKQFACNMIPVDKCHIPLKQERHMHQEKSGSPIQSERTEGLRRIPKSKQHERENDPVIRRERKECVKHNVTEAKNGKCPAIEEQKEPPQEQQPCKEIVRQTMTPERLKLHRGVRHVFGVVFDRRARWGNRRTYKIRKADVEDLAL